MATLKDRSLLTLDVLSKMAGIAVPIVLAVYVQSYSSHKDQADRTARKIDRAASLLPHLASDKENERYMALTVIQTLQKLGEFPPELIPPIADIQARFPNSREGRAAGQVLASANGDAGTASIVRQAVASQPPNAFIQIRDDTQRKDAEAIGQLLKEQGFLVPGVQLVPNTFPPSRNELRYFHPAEADEAAALARKISDGGLPTVPVDASKTFEKYTITPRHYEVWLSPGAKINGQRNSKLE